MITTFNVNNSKKLDRAYILNLSYINIPQLISLKPADESKIVQPYEYETSLADYRNEEYFPMYTNSEYQYRLHGKIYDFLKATDNTDWQSWCYSKQQVKNSIYTVEKEGRLKEMYLHYKNIDNLSPIRYFSNLERLNLNNNFHIDVGELRYFPKLKYLDLNYNKLSGIYTLPALNSLKELGLNNNLITNLIPLKNAPNLEKLEIANNTIYDLSSLPELNLLTCLSLAGNPLNNLAPLSKFKKLDYLNLSTANGKCLETLPPMSSLRQLDISSTYIAGNDTSVFNRLKQEKNLELLNISGNNLTYIYLLGDFIFDKQTKYLIYKNEPLLKKLTTLNLSNNRIEDIFVLQYYTNLRELYLSTNEIKNFNPISKLKNLEILMVSGNKIQNLSAFRDLGKLKHLDVSNNEITDISDLKDMACLEILHLDNNRINNILSISKLNSLKHLYINNNLLTNLGGIEKLSRLETLSISGNSIKDFSPLYALKQLKNLSVSNIGKAELAKLQKQLPGTKVFVYNLNRDTGEILKYH
ncbi:MAG: leucine-rich repeat domain-containing protein [Bacteroidia bacterium]|nr:leucine-rich repeat domain-containing protein [Bacteroidia bacterium]